jgi:hypothetical protein
MHNAGVELVRELGIGFEVWRCRRRAHSDVGNSIFFQPDATPALSTLPTYVVAFGAALGTPSELA